MFVKSANSFITTLLLAFYNLLWLRAAGETLHSEDISSCFSPLLEDLLKMKKSNMTEKQRSKNKVILLPTQLGETL